MLLLGLLMFLGSAKRRHRRRHDVNADVEELLANVKSNGGDKNRIGDDFVLLSALLDKPGQFGIGAEEARSLLLLYGLEKHKDE